MQALLGISMVAIMIASEDDQYFDPSSLASEMFVEAFYMLERGEIQGAREALEMAIEAHNEFWGK